MMNRILGIGFLAIIGSIVAYTIWGRDEESYGQKVREKRQEQINFLSSNPESPFGDSIKFEGLNFFEINQKFEVTAKLSPVELNKLLILKNNKGGEEKYIKYAYADFSINGRDCRLLLLQSFENKESEKLFVPFADLTSGKSTYGAGRYLDVEKPANKTGEVTLDFNLAYNPYCAYNADYVCPLPPKENRLDVAIPAGEKNYKND